MEIDNKSGDFIVGSREPFGRLLVEIMHSQSLDYDVHLTQKRIGQILVSAYLDDEIEYAELFGLESRRDMVHEDIARDLAMKAEVHARHSDVRMSFGHEYFGGLKIIAQREVKDLPELYAEREIVQIAVENSITTERGSVIDQQDVEMIDEEIAQAEASKEVLSLISKFEGDKK